jgi:hypothetical protein
LRLIDDIYAARRRWRTTQIPERAVGNRASGHSLLVAVFLFVVGLLE